MDVGVSANGKQGNLHAGSPKRTKTAPAFLPFFCSLGAAQTRRTEPLPLRPFKPPSASAWRLAPLEKFAALLEIDCVFYREWS